MGGSAVHHTDSADSITFLASSPLVTADATRPVPASLHHASPETADDADFASPSLRHAAAGTAAALPTRAATSAMRPGLLRRRAYETAIRESPSKAWSADGMDMASPGTEASDDFNSGYADSDARGSATREPHYHGPSLAFAVEPGEEDVTDEPFNDRDLADDVEGITWKFTPRRTHRVAVVNENAYAALVEATARQRTGNKNGTPAAAATKRVSSGRLPALSPHVVSRRPRTALASTASATNIVAGADARR